MKNITFIDIIKSEKKLYTMENESKVSFVSRNNVFYIPLPENHKYNHVLLKRDKLFARLFKCHEKFCGSSLTEKKMHSHTFT